MTLPDSEILNNIVSRVFRYDDVTMGDPNKGYFLRYRGTLLRDSVEAYDSLAEALRSYDITPLFRLEDGHQTVLLVRGTIHPKPSNVWINLLLFALTVLSVLFAGEYYSYNGPVPTDTLGMIWATGEASSATSRILKPA